MTETMTAAEYRKLIGLPPAEAVPLTMSLDEYHAYVEGQRARRSKFNNIPCEADGFLFQSGAERDYYFALKLLAQAGEISNLKVHTHYLLLAKAKGRRKIEYIDDFSFDEVGNPKRVVADTKGVITAVFSIKRKLFLEHYPEYELRIVNVGHSRRK